jgi:hypothetical protein
VIFSGVRLVTCLLSLILAVSGMTVAPTVMAQDPPNTVEIAADDDQVGNPCKAEDDAADEDPALDEEPQAPPPCEPGMPCWEEPPPPPPCECGMPCWEEPPPPPERPEEVAEVDPTAAGDPADAEEPPPPPPCEPGMPCWEEPPPPPERPEEVAEVDPAVAEEPRSSTPCAFRMVGGLDDLFVDAVVCDIRQPFSVTGSGITLDYTPRSDDPLSGGTYEYSGDFGDFSVLGSGTYKVKLSRDGGSIVAKGKGKVVSAVGTFPGKGTERYKLTATTC